MYILVIPHITDAIQEWVERVAKQPVSDDGVEPDVRLFMIYFNKLISISFMLHDKIMNLFLLSTIILENMFDTYFCFYLNKTIIKKSYVLSTYLDDNRIISF